MSTPARVVAVLFAVLLFTSAQASAAAIIGRFDLNVEVCDKDLDPFCEDGEYFSVSSDLDPTDPLTFYATVAVGDGSTFDLMEFDGDGVLTAGQSALTLFHTMGFFSSLNTTASLNFFGGNFASYGTLSLSNVIDVNSAGANILFEPEIQSVPEPTSIVLLATGLAMTALRRRRST